MVLFPSYAKRHVKKDWSRIQQQLPTGDEAGGARAEDYWRQEWEKNEDEKAVVDVDVRGWIYTPNQGPMTRRNRMLIGLARQLSGIPAPRPEQATGGQDFQGKNPLQMHEERREQEKIRHEAAKIERRGQEEKHAAYHGEYSERPRENMDPEAESIYTARSHRGSQTPDSMPTSPTLSATQVSTGGQLSDAELTVANANLMARIAPFMTNPTVAHPVTVFFYNDEKSQSKTVITNDAGHFILRAPLDFVPTHVRVLANEELSTIQEIKITEPYGVSLISDVDDTIKKSNISGGAREIFRNTFVRELGDQMVEGVKEWYNQMHDLGVSIHYCSNSPWQLYPVLATYFKLVGLPPGSLHLRQYSGMLQGIFEPVAERKKGTLNRLLHDFPERKFILVGDSGEADLEVYTELVLTHPGRVLAVFIRDVTTPETPGYFDSGFEMPSAKASLMAFDDAKTPRPGERRQNSAPGAVSSIKTPTGPAMGTLIDFSEEPEETKVDLGKALGQVKSQPRQLSSADLLAGKRVPPPRPAKPIALRSSPSIAGKKDGGAGLGMQHDDPTDVPPPKPPRPGAASSHPLAQMHNSSQQTVSSNSSVPRSNASVGSRGPTSLRAKDDENPPPPPPRRRVVPAVKGLSPRLNNYRNNFNSNSDVDYEPLGPAAMAPPTSTMQSAQGFIPSRSSTRSANSTPTGSPTLGAVNKKLEMWKRRLARAHEQLDQQGVQLYTWRRGQDVVAEAVGIVKKAMEDVERRKQQQGRR
jgi:phosphatidate phosphatase APP1